MKLVETNCKQSSALKRKRQFDARVLSAYAPGRTERRIEYCVTPQIRRQARAPTPGFMKLHTPHCTQTVLCKML